MNNPSQEQQLEWGNALAAAMIAWPHLQQLVQTAGITIDPTDLVFMLISQGNTRQTASLASFFTLIENATDHQLKQADAENLE